MLGSTIKISPAARTAMIREAERTYPAEACGLLLGRKTKTGIRIFRAIATENVSPRNKRKAYAIDPLTWLAAEKKAEEKTQEIIGVFHSHPDAPAKPSKTDLRHGFENLSYIILSVRKAKTRSLASFRLNNGKFIREKLSR